MEIYFKLEIGYLSSIRYLLTELTVDHMFAIYAKSCKQPPRITHGHMSVLHARSRVQFSQNPMIKIEPNPKDYILICIIRGKCVHLYDSLDYYFRLAFRTRA